jgi:hypothetical protein
MVNEGSQKGCVGNTHFRTGPGNNIDENGLIILCRLLATAKIRNGMQNND